MLFDSTDKKYFEHQVFKDLTIFSDLYSSVADTIFSFSTQGTRAIANIDTYVLMSIDGTIESIKTVLRNGRINDAYSLLRKYNDSIIINIYTNLYINDNYSINNLIVDKIDNWRSGKNRLPKFEHMVKYIISSSKLKEINDILLTDPIFMEIRNRCNDHMHYNYLQYAVYNTKVYNTERIMILSKYREDLINLFILHLSYLFYLNDHYMGSPGYHDALFAGVDPGEETQYDVNRIVQEIFDNYINIKRPKIVQVIKPKTNMLLE